MSLPLTKEELESLDAYFRAANYLSVGQLYLLDNPLLKRNLLKTDIKKKIVGHWGTVPGQNFIYTHLNRAIIKYDLNMMYISGPGHGGNSMIANTFLEGSYTKLFPNILQNELGIKKLFKQFSFPKGVSSHCAPTTPGSIHEGGELGYSLVHAFGAVLDNPDLIVACTIGDGEAETGALATSWHLNKFLNPAKDGAVLPILHLNGYKISNPTIFSRISQEELISFFKGCGWNPYFVSLKDDNDLQLHLKMANVIDEVIKDIKNIKENFNGTRPIWPMIILKTPKGFTGPKIVDNKKIEGSFRAHQVPITMEKEEHLNILYNWMKSYRPSELFDDEGHINNIITKNIPELNKTMGMNLNANGGKILKELNIPNYENYAVHFDYPGQVETQDTLELSKFIRDIIKMNPNNFRGFAPDEMMSNRFYSLFETTSRTFLGTKYFSDEYLSNDGRIIDSILSEHMDEGLLEGYLLTGRHGFFTSYEAFIRVIDSMAAQHAKWIKLSKEVPWREPIASLNYILTSNVWQQDHNGFTHQDPGFIDHIANKKADISRVYLPADANCLLSVFDHCIRTKNYLNIIIASKHPKYQWLSIDEAKVHCAKGISEWKFASDSNADLVLVSAGDTPTLECLAAKMLIKDLTNLNIKFINVVDLMKLLPNTEHPHGLSNEEFNSLFTTNLPILFIYHGYPTLINEFLYSRENNKLKVLGYIEEGEITTPFDMRVLNKIDRFNIVKNIVELTNYKDKESIIDLMNKKLKEHHKYISEIGQDLPEILNWKWKND